MLTSTPISFSKKTKISGKIDLNSRLRSQNSSVLKKYRDRKFFQKPQAQELEIYLGWTTRDVVVEMQDLGYYASLNIPENLICFDLGFGHLDFHFQRDTSIISAVEFYPKIRIN